MRRSTAFVVVGAAAALVVAAVIALVLIAPWGGGDGGGAGSAAPTDGCSEVTTEELYVQKAFTCPDGTRVVTFASTAARDDYLKVAEHFGTVTVDRGATWARVRI